MARRGSISEAQVFEAADTLVAQGRDVTPTALLDKLGSGSFTTIYKYLSVWEQSKATASADTSMAIPDSVLSSFGAAWRAATVEAGKEVALIREQSAAEVAGAKAQVLEALGTIERLEKELEEDAGEIERLTAKTSEQEAALHEHEAARAAATATMTQLQARLEKAESELAACRKEKDAAASEAAEMRGQVSLLTKQNADLLAAVTRK